MAKPQQQQTSPTVEVTVFRLVPHLDASGERVPERWDAVEETVRGVVTKRVAHETKQALSVARERVQILRAAAAETTPLEKP